MIHALLLAAALTGQTSDYNLLSSQAQDERPPTSRIGSAPTEADIAPGLAADLAESREQLRELRQELATVQAQVRAQAKAQARRDPVASAAVERRPARVTYVEDVQPAAYQSSPTTAGGCYGGSYQSPPPAAQSLPPLVQAAPSSSCYSQTYSSTPPITYSTAPPVTYSLGEVYASAPVMSSMPVVMQGSGGGVYRERTRIGPLGGFRRNVRSAGFSQAPFSTMGPVTYSSGGGLFSSGFFGSGAVCASGSCR
jgi:hypothetical protein